MTPVAANDALFGDALACEEVRPAAFVAGDVSAAAAASACARAEAFLQSIALVEDSRVSDESDDRSPTALALQRVEARLDLLTTLVGRLLQQDGGAAWTGLMWSAVGARLDAATTTAAGATGWLRVQPCDWLPDAISLPVTVLAVDAAHPSIWLRFDAMGPGLTQALERHLFRVHRREIAELRRNGAG